MALNSQPSGYKRRWERHLIDVSTRVVADDLTGGDMIVGRGSEMSEGGIRLFAVADLPIGTQINVELIDSPCGSPVRVRGIVRNRQVYLYGIEFLIHDQEDRQQIARLSRSYSGTPNHQSS
jgi:hypothetical protein